MFGDLVGLSVVTGEAIGGEVWGAIGAMPEVFNDGNSAGGDASASTGDCVGAVVLGTDVGKSGGADTLVATGDMVAFTTEGNVVGELGMTVGADSFMATGDMVAFTTEGNVVGESTNKLGDGEFVGARVSLETVGLSVGRDTAVTAVTVEKSGSAVCSNSKYTCISASSH